MALFNNVSRQLRDIKIEKFKDVDVKYLYDDSIQCYFALDEMEEFVLYHSQLDVPIPELLYFTEVESIHMNADEIVRETCENLGLNEYAYDMISENEIIELQKLLDNWCAKQTDTDTYWPDYSRAVLVSEILAHQN